MPADKPTFNIFQETSKCDIRVGYISTTRGYIPNLTRHEANEHAKLDRLPFPIVKDFRVGNNCMINNIDLINASLVFLSFSLNSSLFSSTSANLLSPKLSIL